MTSDTPARPVGSGLWRLVLAPVWPQVVGSVFNIWYNTAVVIPLLGTEALRHRFMISILWYNVLTYPVATWVWLRAVCVLEKTWRKLADGRSAEVSDAELQKARQRVIDLPWIGALVSGGGWVACIPFFLASLAMVGNPLNPTLYWHLPISFVVSAFIAVTHSFFVIELRSHRYLYPVFFAETRADLMAGRRALSLRGRGLLWAVSAGICPIGSLLLLSFAPPAPATDPAWFAVFVGLIGIAFGIWTALMLARLVAEPVDQLRTAAHAIGQGDLSAEVSIWRADEFGMLAGAFNRMIRELRDKERLRQAFGLHIGRRAAERILARDPGLSGVEQVITVMFVDIRSFTQRSAEVPPAEIVSLLNEFLRVMVGIVEERHGGMINKFLGDGFIALFGIEAGGENCHGDQALAAGRDMLAALPGLNATLRADDVDPIAIGIGLHSGPAIVGSIGSPQRLEFTAIGNTVNLASRIEGLTKSLGEPLLLSEATRDFLCDSANLRTLPPQIIRGLDEPMPLFAPLS